MDLEMINVFAKLASNDGKWMKMGVSLTTHGDLLPFFYMVSDHNGYYDSNHQVYEPT